MRNICNYIHVYLLLRLTIYKIASEHNSKGQLHTDVLQEVKLLHDVYKEIDEKDEPNGYIQHFSCNPFATIMYTKKQLELYLEQNSKHNTPLFLDATGSIIQKIPNQNKRIFYYALVMKNPMEHRSAIPIAEMITNDHHSYEIKHFFNKFISDLQKIRNYRYIPRRVEIDFSWAFVQSVLSAFNNEDVKTYLNRAWKVIRGKCSIKEVEMYTYPHLCAAHMIKDVSRNLKHIKDKGLKDFCVFCFALMQNSTSIDDAKTVFGHMWTVFNTEYETEEVIQSRMILQQMVKEQRIDCLDENITTADEENKTCDDEIKLTNTGTIRQSSKFWHEFKNVITEVKSKQTKDLQQEHQKENIYYDSMCMDILLNKFIYVLPLWSGILLGNLSRYCTQSTKQVLPKEDKEELRSTNNLVENWFGVVKKDILYHKKQCLRASDFIRKQFVNIRGHLTELHIYTRRGIKRKRGESEPKEEWRGKSQKQKRKPKYYSTPRKMPTPKKKKPTAVSEQPSKKKRRHIMKVKREENIISTKMTKRKHDQIGSTERKQSDVPNKNIPSWGGQVMVNNNVIKLVNTCPVDNMLYIMYCINEDKPAIIDTLYKSRDSVCMTLLNVLHLCKEKKWVEAKVIWLEKFCGFTLASEQPWDVYDSEYVHFVKHLSGIQSSFQESVCSQSNCIRKVRRMIAKDISLHAPSDRNGSVQTMITDWWAPGEDSKCKVPREDGAQETRKSRCTGIRRCTSRKFLHFDGTPPFLVTSPTYHDTRKGHNQVAPVDEAVVFGQHRIEADTCPRVVVADIDTNSFVSKQTVHVKQWGGNCPPAPKGYAPTVAWQNMQVADFAEQRQKLARYRALRKKHKLTKFPTIPPMNDVAAWCRLCFGKLKPGKGIQAKPSVEQDGVASSGQNDGMLPLVSTVTIMDQPTVIKVLEYHLNWFEVTGFTEKQGYWFYALLLCLEKPLIPEACSLIRSLARACANLRASLESADDERLVPLNLFICLISRYFDQHDLGDTAS